jgi:hypothetical protein
MLACGSTGFNVLAATIGAIGLPAKDQHRTDDSKELTAMKDYGKTKDDRRAVERWENEGGKWVSREEQENASHERRLKMNEKPD